MNPPVAKKQIVWAVGSQFGGVGKTTASMLVTDYLRQTDLRTPEEVQASEEAKAKNDKDKIIPPRFRKVAVIDLDSGKWGKPSSLDYFLGCKARRLNIRKQQDMDTILELTAESDVDVVVVDAPANSRANMDAWWRDVATKDVIDSIGISLIVLGAVSPAPGSTESVLDSMQHLGDRATYLIALNRTSYDSSEDELKQTFPDWFNVDTTGFNIKTFEIPHVQEFAMSKFVKAGVLPSKLNGQVTLLDGKRIAVWTKAVHQQLAATGLF